MLFIHNSFENHKIPSLRSSGSSKRRTISHTYQNMASTNADSMNPKQGEFMPHKPRDQPMTTTGHQPGRIVSERDQTSEFSAHTLPAGSAPASRTFEPNPQSATPSQADNTDVLGGQDKESTFTPASATLGGADSRDLHQGLGHPGQGQTSTEIRHDGEHHRKRDGDGAGLQGVGSSGGRGIDDPAYNEPHADQHPKGPVPAREHNATLPGAEDRLPESM
jgi:hypothetical protein